MSGRPFVAFDPNRMNPFMYLYRDRSSPLYSPVGVTPNQRPVLAREIFRVLPLGRLYGGYPKPSRICVIAMSPLRGVRWLLPDL